MTRAQWIDLIAATAFWGLVAVIELHGAFGGCQ